MTTTLNTVNLTNSTATTPSAGDDSTAIATTAFVDGAITGSLGGTQNAGLISSRGFYVTADPDTTPPESPYIYQNTDTTARLVVVSGDLGGGGFHGDVYCDGGASPTTLVAEFGRVNAGSSDPNYYPASVTFMVPTGHYYGISVTSGSGSPFVRSWTEYTLP